MKNKLTISVCPNCGSGNIKKVRKNWKGTSKSTPYIVPSLTYYECPDCKEKIYDREAMQKIEEKSPVYKHNKKGKRVAA